MNENDIGNTTPGQGNNEKHFAYVDMTLQTGIKPLEMRFAAIYSASDKEPVAFRSFTYINSVMRGVVSPEEYRFAADTTDVGVRLAKWNVETAISAIKYLLKEKKSFAFVTARCPSRLIEAVDIYDWLKEIFERTGFDTPEKLCIEFPESLLFGDLDKARTAVLDCGLLKVPVMMSGCGADDCPLASLMRVPITYALVDPSVVALLNSKTKSTTASALLAFLRTAEIDVIGDSVTCDDHISALYRTDCYGYIPAVNYSGAFEHHSARMTMEEAAECATEEEDY